MAFFKTSARIVLLMALIAVKPSWASAKDLHEPIFGPDGTLPIDHGDTLKIHVQKGLTANFEFANQGFVPHAIVIYDCHSLEELHIASNVGSLLPWTFLPDDTQNRCLLITGWHMEDGSWVQSPGKKLTKEKNPLFLSGGFEDGVDDDDPEEFNDIAFGVVIHVPEP